MKLKFTACPDDERVVRVKVDNGFTFYIFDSTVVGFDCGRDAFYFLYKTRVGYEVSTLLSAFADSLATKVCEVAGVTFNNNVKDCFPGLANAAGDGLRFSAKELVGKTMTFTDKE